MKKESNRNRTRRTAVALALLLAFAAPQALRGNLGIYAPTCGGCGDNPLCGGDNCFGNHSKDTDSPSDSGKLGSIARQGPASGQDAPRIFNSYI